MEAPSPAGVEFHVADHGSPQLAGAEEKPGPPPGIEAPLDQAQLVALGWTPAEIESMLAAIWFFGAAVYSVVKWNKPAFALKLAARKGELTPSATALVPAFDAYIPKSIGGPAGVGFAGVVVVGDFIRMYQAREPLLAAGPPPDPAAGPPPGTVERSPAPRPPAPNGGAYRVPEDLADAIGPSQAEQEGIPGMGYR